jgi:hypothetical protein
MYGDIATQSPNLDVLTLRNVIIIVAKRVMSSTYFRHSGARTHVSICYYIMATRLPRYDRFPNLNRHRQ